MVKNLLTASIMISIAILLMVNNSFAFLVEPVDPEVELFFVRAGDTPGSTPDRLVINQGAVLPFPTLDIYLRLQNESTPLNYGLAGTNYKILFEENRFTALSANDGVLDSWDAPVIGTGNIEFYNYTMASNVVGDIKIGQFSLGINNLTPGTSYLIASDDNLFDRFTLDNGYQFNDHIRAFDVQVNVVPEPGTLILLITGVMGLVGIKRKVTYK